MFQKTVAQNQKQPKIAKWWNDKTLFVYHFVRSNYVTAIWNWFMGFMGKAAEPVLTATVIYSGYKLLPGVTIDASIDNFVFVVQQIALDIGGIGMVKLAQQAKDEGNEQGAKNASRIGKALVGLMIVGVVVAASSHSIKFAPDIMTGIETVLLIARAVMAVLYGYTIHSLKKGHKDEPLSVVKSSDVNERLDEITQALNQFTQQLQVVQSSVPQVVQSQVQQVVQAVVQSQARVIVSEVQGVVHEVVQQQVQDIVLDQVQAMREALEASSNTADFQELAERLEAVSTSVQEMHTTITEVRTVTQKTAIAERSTKTLRSGSRQKENEPLRVVHSTAKKVESELAGELPEVRVKRFISERIEQGYTPSLTEIVNQCKVSKNTAIRYRREMLGGSDEQGEDPDTGEMEVVTINTVEAS